ncbi:hypothetical protein SLE2022_313520 [Rubroshorea leprosula]
MAYRRQLGMTRASTFKEEINNHVDDSNDKSSNPQLTSSHSFPSSSLHMLSTRSPSDSLAAQATRASAARRESPVFGGDSSPRFGGGDRDISPKSKVSLSPLNFPFSRFTGRLISFLHFLK